ncbi:MAG: UDP-N-acetylglucosamine 2-epimerase (non-hydrolyzing) [Patescibacteria group bacterium]|nr:UDP-N-acetylglucosamine 2-epimerase (non-hydrolyzing) [Patescibacteria group bacterium]MDE2172644.1 UDP-N-acetylglucosamine 2-epimerase (non-hydrolyzing) [Patescibacteria group bacterium]
MPTKRPLKILNIVGARPNFMKMAALYAAYRKHPQEIIPILVNTRQHADPKMSDVFLKSLDLPQPEYDAIIDIESVIKKETPDIVLVVGDVNSTLAGAKAAQKCGVPVAHVESGLRSGDQTMPEERNRIAVDKISQWLFVTEQSGMDNLKKEGLDTSHAHLVGNVMIDTLIRMMPQIDASPAYQTISDPKLKYAVMTMHRPANVDTKNGLKSIFEVIHIVAKNNLLVVFPIHPRTLNNVEAEPELKKQLEQTKNLIPSGPMPYIDFMNVVKHATVVLTDSGGIQEEAAYLKKPTITLRDSTERPSTVDCGANHICSLSKLPLIEKTLKEILADSNIKIADVPFNDGQAADRIVDILLS